MEIVTQPKSIAFVAVRPTISMDYEFGITAYIDGLALDDLDNDDQRKGWLSANRAEAEAATAGYAESMGW